MQASETGRSSTTSELYGSCDDDELASTGNSTSIQDAIVKQQQQTKLKLLRLAAAAAAANAANGGKVSSLTLANLHLML